MQPSSLDYISHLEDEISLEGLDGITLEALWLRLSERANFTTYMPIDAYSKQFLWTLVTSNPEIEIYKLPEPRSPLVIFNRYQYMDAELGIVLEPEEEPHDIYKFAPIKENDPRNKRNERGSCASFYTRDEITHDVQNLTLQEIIAKYGESLVMVASQKLRNKALGIDAFIDPFYDLTSLQYQLLERIGRSRNMGEITQGKMSLAVMGENPKSMFYHRKRLLKMNLIIKQPHQQKGFKGQSQIGSLIHLRRFYVERKSKFIVMIERAVEILKSKPQHFAPHHILKEEMAMPEPSLRKLFKSPEFQKYIKIVPMPYREIYPNAPPTQWKCKVKDVERVGRCLQLVNPSIDLNDVCKVEETNDYDEDEEEAYTGILDQSKIVWGVSVLQQAYQMVEDAGPEGVSQTDIARRLGQTKLDARTICRNLQRRNTVHSLMKDVGRQRVSRYVSHKYAVTGHLTQEFRKERQKMISMIGSTDDVIDNNDQDLETKVKNEVVDASTSADKAEVDVKTSPKPSTSLQQVFDPVESVICDRSPSKEDGNLPKSKGFPNLLDEIRLTYSNQKRKSPHVTTRMMKRANIIIHAVKEHKVIDDAFKLQKLIVQAESEEGLAVKMDKKSLNRLLDKLAQGGFLRIINVKLKYDKFDKAFKFVVHSSVSTDDAIFKSAIEQQKMKFMAFPTENKVPEDPPPPPVIKLKPSQDPTVDASMLELKKMQQLEPKKKTDSTGKKVEGLKGSLNPKFIRMHELHKLLFYLVYGYEGDENIDQEVAWQKVKNNHSEVKDEDITEYPRLYLEEVSWKMFIPPLPHHANSGPGWAFVCDVLLRLPLCVFVHLVSVIYSTPDLKKLLDHPVKKNLLIKYLPTEIRSNLLQGRKYITYVLDLVNRLCYVGLTQFGPQIMKEKDQVFIYLNRKASLIDTTTSSPGYHQISTDKEYVRNNYQYQTMQDVEQYWYDMLTICMHTPLGGHNCMEGKKITIQILERKPQIMETLNPHTVEEAAVYDVGKIPGDGRGAAGLDSALFSHLKRNWSTTYTQLAPVSKTAQDAKSREGSICYTNYLMNTVHPQTDGSVSKPRLFGLKSSRLSVYKPKPGSELKPSETATKLVNRSNKANGRKRKREVSQDQNKTSFQVAKKSRKPSCYQRELKARRKVTKKPYYDEEDKAALRRMKKLRVDWSPAEDSFLLLCKVGCCYLFPNKRSQMITFSLIRSLLHSRFPESRNKTSRACQRRINYIMKNPTTENNVAIFLEEVKQDSSITKKFQIPRIPCNKVNVENVYSKIFKDLMDCLVNKFTNTESRKCPNLPNTLQEFNDKFELVVAASSLKNKLRFKEVASLSDIDSHVINSLIYSSLCTVQDRESFAYQLYLAYQQYHQSKLNAVLQSMRADQMISYKKRYNRSVVTQSCLPLSTSPFQLSVSYLHLFNSKHPFDIFGQCWKMLKQLLKNKQEDIEDIYKGRDVQKSKVKTFRNKSFKLTAVKRANRQSSADFEVIKCDSTRHRKQSIIINHEGGYCAAIVALMATKQIAFDCVIPEQIIVKDVEELVPKESKSIYRRFSDHAHLSGRRLDNVDLSRVSEELSSQDKDSASTTSDTNNTEEEGPSEINTPNVEPHSNVKREVLFSRPNVKIAIEVDFDSTYKDQQPPADEALRTTQEPSNASSNIKVKSEGHNVEFEAQDDIQNKTSVYNGSSRVSLFMLRESFNDSSNVSMQRNQEHFLVNACNITCFYSTPVQCDKDTLNDSKRDDIINTIVPLTKTDIELVLNKCKDAIVKETTTLEERKEVWKDDGVPNMLIKQLCDVYHYIESSKEIGASLPMIKEHIELKGVDHIKILHMLRQDNLILRVGVACIRWVTLQHMKPWLIQTNKITRAMRQAIPRLSGVYSLNSDNDKSEASLQDSLPHVISDQSTELITTNNESEKEDDAMEQTNDIQNEMPEVSTTVNKEPTKSSQRIRRKRMSADVVEPPVCPALKKSRIRTPGSYRCKRYHNKDQEKSVEMEEAAQLHCDTTNYEQINVAVRPWIRLNGSLNRRVLDRMLGSVLIVIMERPGITAFDVASRFSPGLQPAHTCDLLDILYDLKCITKRTLSISHKVSLFGDPVEYVLSDAQSYDCSEDLVIEPTVDCILKLSSFIGDKLYSIDFLSGETRPCS